MKKTFLPAAAVLALAFAGCGDDDSVALSGPASVMPADAPIYIEATIRPDGENADNLDALLSELGELPLIGEVGDPGDLLIQQLEAQAASAGVDFSYADDIEPWLGEKVGIAVLSADDGSERFVAALETTDEEAARDAIEGLLSGDAVPYEEAEYEGVSYFSAPGDSYRLGIFDGHVVLAPPDDFEAAVDASGEGSLAESDKLADSLARLGDDSLASVYLDLEQLASFATTPEDAEEFEQAKAVVPEFFDGAIAISAGISAGDQVYIDYAAPMFEGQPEAGASALLGTAPGDSFGAIALEDLGAFGPPVVDLFERAEEAGADLEDFPEEGIEAAFEEETGIAFGDAAAAIGDVSVWARGDLPDGIEVGGEIAVEDTEVATELIELAEAKAEEEGGAKIGPPVGGSDVGFSALEESFLIPGSGLGEGGGDLGFDPESGDFEEIPGHAAGDLPFANIELDGDVIRYGFFADEEAAKASDPDGAGDFAGTDAYAAGQEALGDDFEYLGVVDLGPILDEFARGPSVTDAVLGGSPEDLIGGFVAQKLGVVALGQRFEDGVLIQRYVLRLAE